MYRPELGELVICVHPDRGWTQAEVLAIGMGVVTLWHPQWGQFDCPEELVEAIPE